MGFYRSKQQSYRSCWGGQILSQSRTFMSGFDIQGMLNHINLSSSVLAILISLPPIYKKFTWKYAQKCDLKNLIFKTLKLKDCTLKLSF